MAIKIKNSNGEWVVDQKAIETSIIDLNNNFESTNVEGALRELAEKVKNGGNADTVSGYTIWTGTQSEYDAISSKNSTTIYFIKG